MILESDDPLRVLMISLSGALNDWGYGLEEMNDSGTNWWIYTGEEVDGGLVFRPFVEPEGFFEDVDICLRGENRTVTVPHENRVVCVKETT